MKFHRWIHTRRNNAAVKTNETMANTHDHTAISLILDTMYIMTQSLVFSL